MLRYRFGTMVPQSDTEPVVQPLPVTNTGNQARNRIVQQQRRSQRTSRTWMMNRR